MEPDRDDALAALDDATLRRIAYGRDDTSGDVTREEASRELATRDEARHANAVGSDAKALASPLPVDGGGDEGAGLDSYDGLPPPWWTRARKLAALAFAASLVVGTAVGVGADRVADALAPASLEVFDQPSTDAERAAAAAMVEIGVLSATDLGEVREIATVRDVTVYAQLRAAGASVPRDNLGEQVCLMAVVSETGFYFPECVPRGVFDSQGVALTLNVAVSGGSTTRGASAPRIAVHWGPNGGADVRIIDNAGER